MYEMRGSMLMSNRVSYQAPLPDTDETELDVSWRPRLEDYTSKIHGKQPEDKLLPRKIRTFYQQQDELIEDFVALLNERASIATQHLIVFEQLKRKAILYAQISLAANVVLLVIKLAAAVLSGSLSIIVSVIDSVIDLFSGILFWLCNHAIINRDNYDYPQGRTRLEPVAIIVLCCITSAVSFEVVVESVQRIFSLSQVVPLNKISLYTINNKREYLHINDSRPYAQNRQVAEQIVFGIETIAICATAIGIKMMLYMMCRQLPSPSVQALAQDHRNDVLSNSVALAGGLIGYKLFPYADPIGAILISIYIICTWAHTGWIHVEMLTGLTAPPEFLQKMTWLALNHHSEITYIDTVSAFHFGTHFLVEIHIVLPENMNVLEAHNIAEALQNRLERVYEVERAFVHIDYEVTHDPKTEHKVN